jgi:IS66 C-terminal element
LRAALFAGSDQGGVHWGRDRLADRDPAKLNAIDPQAYLADVLSRLVNRHPASQIDQLMPWAYANPPPWPENENSALMSAVKGSGSILGSLGVSVRRRKGRA